MDCERNRSIDLVNYIESQGISVNMGKNKARGNRGFFSQKNGSFRIDISKDVEDNAKIRTLLHEFAHYIHYKYDKTLQSFNFIWGDISNEDYEELLAVTIHSVPKDFAQSLYAQKKRYAEENKCYISSLKKEYRNFKSTKPFSPLEVFKEQPLKYLLKYDRVKFNNKIYSLENLRMDFKNISDSQAAYILLKSNQRKISKINAKINRLNKYYNQPAELWARFFEIFFTDKHTAAKIAPKLSERFEAAIKEKLIPEISKINEILYYNK